MLTSDGVETGHSEASSRIKNEERVQCACNAWCVWVCVCETESEKADENKLFRIILFENQIPFS